MEGIQNSCRDGYSLSLKDSNSDRSKREVIFDLFGGCTPPFEDVERINWPRPDPSQPQSSCGPSQPDPEHTGWSSEGNSVPNDSKTTSGARALLDVSSTPDMRDVDELVATEIAANWQRVALRLGVEGCVSEVVLKNHPNDCEGACRDMLDR